MRSYVYLGDDPVTGKQLRKWVSGKTEKELQKKKDAIRIAYGRGEVSAKDIRFGEFALLWFQVSYPKGKTNANTWRMYDVAVNNLIKRFGGAKMSKIRQIDIESYFAVRPPRAAEIELITIKRIMKKARKNRYVGDDPAEDIKLPKRARKTKRDLDAFEKEAISKADLSAKERAFVYLGLYCGLRRGEILALYKSDITHRVKVSKAATIDHKGMAIKDMPKTESSVRTVPIPDTAMTAIKAYADAIEDGKPLFGSMDRTKYWRFWHHITCRVNDAAGGKSHFDEKKRYRTIDERNLLTPFSAHIMRHAYCCELYRKGYRPGEVMRLMGHKSIAMSIEVYEHIKAEKITADKMNGVRATRSSLPVLATFKVAKCSNQLVKQS